MSYKAGCLSALRMFGRSAGSANVLVLRKDAVPDVSVLMQSGGRVDQSGCSEWIDSKNEREDIGRKALWF
jgi:hypothetical protein